VSFVRELLPLSHKQECSAQGGPVPGPYIFTTSLALT